MKKRNRKYLHEVRHYRKVERWYFTYAQLNDDPIKERNLVEKLRIKKGGKTAAKQLAYEAWCDEMSSICPNG